MLTSYVSWEKQGSSVTISLRLLDCFFLSLPEPLSRTSWHHQLPSKKEVLWTNRVFINEGKEIKTCLEWLVVYVILIHPRVSDFYFIQERMQKSFKLLQTYRQLEQLQQWVMTSARLESVFGLDFSHLKSEDLIIPIVFCDILKKLCYYIMSFFYLRNSYTQMF